MYVRQRVVQHNGEVQTTAQNPQYGFSKMAEIMLALGITGEMLVSTPDDDLSVLEQPHASQQDVPAHDLKDLQRELRTSYMIFDDSDAAARNPADFLSPKRSATLWSVFEWTRNYHVTQRAFRRDDALLSAIGGGRLLRDAVLDIRDPARHAGEALLTTGTLPAELEFPGVIVRHKIKPIENARMATVITANSA